MVVGAHMVDSTSSDILPQLSYWWTRINNNMTQARDLLYLTTTLLITTLVLFTGLGTLLTSCTTLNKPAQQQKISTPSTTSKQSEVAVSQIDLNSDGTISAQEKQLLIDSQPDVNLTFAVIMGLVLLISLACAWAARRESTPPTKDSAVSRVKRMVGNWASGARSKDAEQD